MPRIDMETFEEGTEIVRVYLALALDEAARVERVLEGAGVEYGVEVEELDARGPLGLRTARRAAGFWIRMPALDAAEAALLAARLVKGLVKR